MIVQDPSTAGIAYSERYQGGQLKQVGFAWMGLLVSLPSTFTSWSVWENNTCMKMFFLVQRVTFVLIGCCHGKMNCTDNTALCSQTVVVFEWSDGLTVVMCCFFLSGWPRVWWQYGPDWRQTNRSCSSVLRVHVHTGWGGVLCWLCAHMFCAD